MWTFRCYDDGGDETLWRQWYDSASGRSRGVHDRILEELEQLENWAVSPHVKRFVSHTFEIRVMTDLQWRIAGCYEPNHTFVILHIGYHKQRVYTPRDFKESVAIRFNAVKSDIKRAPICVRPK